MRNVEVRLLIAVTLLVSACGGGGGGDGNAFPGAEGPRNDYHGFAIADVDDDGALDIVATRATFDPTGPDPRAVEVYLRDPANPARFLAPAVYPLDAVPYRVSTGDLDADGWLDVVVACTFSESGVRVFFQDDAGGGVLEPPQFLAAPAAIYATAVVDLDADGLADILAVTDTALIGFIQKAAAPRTFADPVTIGPGSRRLAVADVDADQLVDLVTPASIGTASGDTLLHLQDSAVPGSFLPPIAVTAVHGVTDTAVADLDRDGALDLVAAGVSGGIGRFRGVWTLFVADAARPSGFRLASTSELGDAIDTLAAQADLDGDGDIELVLGRRTSANDANAFDVYRRDGGDRFVVDGVYTIPNDRAVTVPELYTIAIADVNADTLPDVVVSTNEIFYFPQRADAPRKFGAAVRIAAQR